MVEDAVATGAHLATGGHALERPGHFLEPTVLGDVTEAACLNREAIFGPVAAIRTFADEKAMLAAANDTRFGLVAFVYTEDLRKALRMVDALEAGMVGVNRGIVSNAAAPFGGAKQSGLGREGIEEYLEVRYATIDP